MNIKETRQDSTEELPLLPVPLIYDFVLRLCSDPLTVKILITAPFFYGQLREG